MSDDIETLRAITTHHVMRGTPVQHESLAVLDRLVADRDSLRKALDDRYAADLKAAKAIFAATGRTSGFPSVKDVVAFYVAEADRLEKERDWFKGLVNSHDLLKDNAKLHAKLDRATVALQRADQFITNGVEFGFIQMPDNDTPDTAHGTPALIRTVYAELSADAPAQQPQISDDVREAMAEAEKALEFYADKQVYEPDSTGRVGDLTFIARAVLAKLRSVMK